jgi:hypothetical protein
MAPNPPATAALSAVVPPGATKVTLRVWDAKGEAPIKVQELPNDAGLHVVHWGLTRDASAGGGREGRGGVQDFMQRMGRTMGDLRGMRGGSLAAGTYRVELEIDGKTLVRPLVIVR